MRPSESHAIETPGGPRLHLESWRGIDSRGTLIVAPGLGDHCGRYAHLATRLADEPGLVDVVGFDFRGHGRSEGRRGVVGGYEELVDDLVRATSWVRSRSGDRPLFVLGHSNGGLVALVGVLEGRVDCAGLILTSPALRLRARVPNWKLWAGRVLEHVASWVTLGGRLPSEHLSRDPQMQQARRADPLVHCRLSPPIFFGMQQAGELVHSRAREIRVPTLLIVGMQDPVIDPEAMISLQKQLGPSRCTLVALSSGVHEPLHDLGWSGVVDRIGAWIRERLDSPLRQELQDASRERSAE